MTAPALLLALALMASAGTPPAGGGEPLPAGAPTGDYELTAWCYGALGEYLEVYDRVKPDLRDIDRMFGSSVKNEAEPYSADMSAARKELKIWRGPWRRRKRPAPARSRPRARWRSSWGNRSGARRREGHGASWPARGSHGACPIAATPRPAAWPPTPRCSARRSTPTTRRPARRRRSPPSRRHRRASRPPRTRPPPEAPRRRPRRRGPPRPSRRSPRRPRRPPRRSRPPYAPPDPNGPIPDSPTPRS